MIHCSGIIPTWANYMEDQEAEFASPHELEFFFADELGCGHIIPHDYARQTINMLNQIMGNLLDICKNGEGIILHSPVLWAAFVSQEHLCDLLKINVLPTAENLGLLCVVMYCIACVCAEYPLCERRVINPVYKTMFLLTKMVSNDIEDGVSSFDVEDGVSSFGKPMLHLSPQHLINGGLNQLSSAQFKLKDRVHMIYHSEDANIS